MYVWNLFTAPLLTDCPGCRGSPVIGQNSPIEVTSSYVYVLTCHVGKAGPPLPGLYPTRSLPCPVSARSLPGYYPTRPDPREFALIPLTIELESGLSSDSVRTRFGLTAGGGRISLGSREGSADAR